VSWIWSVLILSLVSSLAFGKPDDLSHQLSSKLGKLASFIPTVVSFEHFDPRQTLRSVTFTYTWDLGIEEVHKGPLPFVKCHYTSSGNYTFQLSIEANTPQHSRLTGLYSVDLTVLDARKTIEWRRPLLYNVDQSSIGTHCLELSVINNISNLQISYNIYCILIFILPCVAVIVAALIFLSASVCRPRQQSLISKALVSDQIRKENKNIM
uniref:PKD domain-containing protein n=1 Tax=Cyprinus carpio TaxID=7962 RepID=A0A8C2FNT0_CYPCA